VVIDPGKLGTTEPRSGSTWSCAASASVWIGLAGVGRPASSSKPATRTSHRMPSPKL